MNEWSFQSNSIVHLKLTLGDVAKRGSLAEIEANDPTSTHPLHKAARRRDKPLYEISTARLFNLSLRANLTKHEVPRSVWLMSDEQRKRPAYDPTTRMYRMAPSASELVTEALTPDMVWLAFALRYREALARTLEVWTSTDPNASLTEPTTMTELARSCLTPKQFATNQIARTPTFAERRVDYVGGVPARKVAVRTKKDLMGRPVIYAHYNIEPQGIPDEVIRDFMAAIWSSLSEVKIPPETPSGEVPEEVRVQNQSIVGYLACNLNMRRAALRFNHVVASHQHPQPLERLILAVRNDIDSKVVVANHFVGTRENPSTERRQAQLSAVFGYLYEKYSLASPVSILRRLFVAEDHLGLGLREPEEADYLPLLTGVGHCGEHAKLAFRVMQSLRAMHPEIKTIVLGKHVYIDHAYVLVNVVFREIFKTVKRIAPSPDGNNVVYISDLAAALAELPFRPFLLDAYMDLSAFDTDPHSLLRHMHNIRKRDFQTSYIHVLDYKISNDIAREREIDATSESFEGV